MKKGFHCWQNPSVNSFQFQIQLPVLAPALVCDDHAYCAAAVLLFTYKHAIKVHFLGLFWTVKVRKENLTFSRQHLPHSSFLPEN